MITTPYPRIPHAHCAFHTVCRQRTTQGLRRERPGRALAQQVYLAVSWTLANESTEGRNGGRRESSCGNQLQPRQPGRTAPRGRSGTTSNARLVAVNAWMPRHCRRSRPLTTTAFAKGPREVSAGELTSAGSVWRRPGGRLILPSGTRRSTVHLEDLFTSGRRRGHGDSEDGGPIRASTLRGLREDLARLLDVRFTMSHGRACAFQRGRTGIGSPSLRLWLSRSGSRLLWFPFGVASRTRMPRSCLWS